MGYFNYLKSHLLFFSATTLILVASVSISLFPRIIYEHKTVSDKYDFNVAKLPVLKSSNGVPVLSAQGVFAVDLDSGVTLYEKNPDTPLLPASTTKMITALVAMDYYKDSVIINTGKVSIEGQKMNLQWNENISFKNLLYGLLVESANDAAEVLAQNYPGGRDAFVQKMNEKAQLLHAPNTHFINPTGLDGEGQVTTAKDLVRIATYAMKNPEFASVVATKEYVARSADDKIIHYLVTKNELLGKVKGVLGVKTGWTENARENLVTYIDRDGKKIMTAILGSQDRFGETEELISWVFDNYNWVAIDSGQLHLSESLHSSR